MALGNSSSSATGKTPGKTSGAPSPRLRSAQEDETAMDQGRPGERRTRDLSWGDARARALMHALARDAATRAGFRVCAIEVVRPKGLLEFVAIYGDVTSAEERLGTASRLG